jgi:ankyrin repeat protein
MGSITTKIIDKSSAPASAISLQEAIDRAHHQAKSSAGEWTALCYAIEMNHVGAIEALASEDKEGINKRCSAACGGTALHMASSKGLTNAVTILLKASCDVMALDATGDTPLHCAAVYGHTGTAKILIEKGEVSLINAKNNEGLSALHIASGFGHLEFVTVLLETNGRGQGSYYRPDVDINAINVNGKTPLHYAAINGSKALVRLLLDRGARVDVLKRDKVLCHFCATFYYMLSSYYMWYGVLVAQTMSCFKSFTSRLGREDSN